MNVKIGASKRWGHDSSPRRLIVDVANRDVLACTGCAGDKIRRVPFDAVREELTCGPCRAFWKRAARASNS